MPDQIPTALDALPSPRARVENRQRDAVQAVAARPRSGEFFRKLLHMSPGLLPFALGLIPHPRPLDWISQAVVVTCCVVLTMIFLSLHRVVKRPGEDNLLSTAVSYPATVIATILLFPAFVELTGVVVVVLALGDGAAYIGGKTFGRRKLPWNSDKSWIGTLSFVAVSGPISTLAYWMLSDGQPFHVAAACGFAASICAAVAESLPVRLTDNLRVGVTALFASAVTHHALVGLRFF